MFGGYGFPDFLLFESEIFHFFSDLGVYITPRWLTVELHFFLSVSVDRGVLYYGVQSWPLGGVEGDHFFLEDVGILQRESMV